MNRLLTCIDGSHYSEICCQYAAWLAKRTQGKVDTLYVTELRYYEIPMIADFAGSLGVQPYQGLMGQMEELEEHKAKFLAEAAEALIKKHGYQGNVTSHHDNGSLVDAVLELEESPEAPDIVLLGKRGEHANLASGHLGSSMERVVRASQRPCLVTNREFRDINKVLIAYDGGQSCRKAVEWFTVHPDFRDLELHVVTVDEHHQSEQIADTLRGAEGVLRSGGYQPTCQTLTGVAEVQIADYVEQNNIDLLVTGAYGHSRIRELLIGSTTTNLLRNCLIPVLMFR